MSDKGSEVSVPFDFAKKFTAIVPVNTVYTRTDHPLSDLLKDVPEPILARFDVTGKDGKVWVIHKPLKPFRKYVEICYDPEAEVTADNLFPKTFFRCPPKNGHTYSGLVRVLAYLDQKKMEQKEIAKISGRSISWVCRLIPLIKLSPQLLEIMGGENGARSILTMELATKLIELPFPVQMHTWQKLSKKTSSPEREELLEKILIDYRRWLNLQPKKPKAEPPRTEIDVSKVIKAIQARHAKAEVEQIQVVRQASEFSLDHLGETFESRPTG